MATLNSKQENRNNKKCFKATTARGGKRKQQEITIKKTYEWSKHKKHTARRKYLTINKFKQIHRNLIKI